MRSGVKQFLRDKEDDLYAAEKMVQANLDKLNVDTLFSKNSAVTNEYASMTAKLISQISMQ